MPAWLIAMGGLSIVTFATYAFDKYSAVRGLRRIPEATLHLLGVLGGWPGALLGQRLLRHKTRKTRFQVMFWFTVGVNLAGLWWLLQS